MKVRTRFAPSPTGFLHIGNAYSALISFAFAKKHQGKFIIRIEDTDVKRYVEGAEEKIYEWLDWLGIRTDESPQKGGFYGPYRQSERLEIYQKYAHQLIEKGDAYYCFCSEEKLKRSRQKQQKQGQPPMYDRCCRDGSSKEAQRKIKKGGKHVVRMKIPENEKIVVPDLIRGEVIFNSQVIDDQVLLKSDGFPTYHLAVVVDDYLMKISHVVRGEDWLSSAPKHFLLYRYLGWKPPLFLHTAIIRNPDRSKIGKRQGHSSLEWYIKKGYLPETLVNYLSLLGWSHPQEKDIFSFEEFVKYFDLKDLSPVGPVFDLGKLNWMNGCYLRKKSNQALLQLIKPFAPSKMTESLIKQTVPLIKDRLKKLSDFPELVDFFLKEPKIYPRVLIQKGKDKKSTKKILECILKELEKIKEKEWQTQRLEKNIRQFCGKSKDWTTSQLFMSIRVAITGKTTTPPLFETMAVLGKKSSLERLKTAIKKLT